MKKEEILAVLVHHQARLQQMGVAHIALFGSRARAQEHAASDIDLLVQLAPEARLDVYRYTGLKRQIAALFNEQVDIVNQKSLKPHMRAAAERDSLYAF